MPPGTTSRSWQRPASADGGPGPSLHSEIATERQRQSRNECTISADLYLGGRRLWMAFATHISAIWRLGRGDPLMVSSHASRRVANV